MKGLFEGLIEINTNYYFKFDNEDDAKFRVIKGAVWQYATEHIYKKLVYLNEIEKLEDIPQEKKEKYSKLVNIYCERETDEIKIIASRCAYVTEIITSTY